MAQADAKQMIVGLDIGTSKVVAVVGEVNPDGGTRG
jgi:cell division protein FtsA